MASLGISDGVRLCPAKLQSQLVDLHSSYIGAMQPPVTHNIDMNMELLLPHNSSHSLLGEIQNSLSLEFNMM